MLYFYHKTLNQLVCFILFLKFWRCNR